MTRTRVLVVDDKPTFLELFRKLLEERMDVRTAPSGAKALAILAIEAVDVVVTDVRMPGLDGLGLLAEIKRTQPSVEVILVTAYGTIPQAVEAMSTGAFHYLTKPFDPDEAIALVEAAAERRRAAEMMRSARASSAQASPWRSPRMQAVVSAVERAARSASPVLLIGEPGSGRRTLARAIHVASAQRDAPFMEVGLDLAGVDAAARPQIGEAPTGTRYLAEVDRLTEHAQAVLERALDGRARWIVSTEEPLERAVLDGRFSASLHERLVELPIAIPALRERQEDVPALVRAMLATSADHVPPLTPTAEALAALVAYDWPGNLRELEAVLRAASAAATGRFIGREALPAEVCARPDLRVDPARLIELSYREVVDLARDRATRDYLIELLRAAKGNVTHAAQRAALERESFHRLLRRFHIRAEDFRERA